MMNLFSNLNILGIFTNITDCESILGAELTDVLKDIYRFIQIAVPILVTALSTLDIVRAVIAQEDKDMEAAKSKAIKRVIIGLAFFFVPIILDVLLDFAGISSGTCHLTIGG